MEITTHLLYIPQTNWDFTSFRTKVLTSVLISVLIYITIMDNHNNDYIPCVGMTFPEFTDLEEFVTRYVDNNN